MTGRISFFVSTSSESLTDDDDDDDDDDSVSLCGSVLMTVAPGSSMWWWGCRRLVEEAVRWRREVEVEEEDNDNDSDDGGDVMSFFIFIFFLERSGGKGEAVGVLCGGLFICICARVMMSCRVMPRVSRSTELWGNGGKVGSR